MNQDHLVRIEKIEKANGVWCFRIFGLNLFAVNKVQEQEYLDLKFITCVIRPYETICLIGAPAPINWKNEMKRRGRTLDIEDLLGKETPYHEIPVWYYGGNFGEDPQEYGLSILFGLKSEKMLRELSEVFFQWDALALLLYRAGQDGLSAARNTLHGFTTEPDLIEAVLHEARYLVLTQADSQYLEMYTKASDVESELDAARIEVEDSIKSTEWYQEHKDMLVWDDTEACYVISK